MIIKKSLADEVAARLQEQISLGQYQTNDRLPIEPDLMKIFGVGRSTVREAIKILVNAGLLRVQQGVGTFVEKNSAAQEPLSQRLKRARTEDLDEVRQLLEMKIAEKAAACRTHVDISKIQEALSRRIKAAQEGKLQECVDADIDFHVAIAEASGNDILADLYKTVSIHLRSWFMNIYEDTKAFEETHPLHEQLFKSIVAGNTKKSWSCAAQILGHCSQ